MRREIDALAAEADPFHLETGALLMRAFLLQADASARADHSLPRQRVAEFAQHLNNLPVIERITRSRGDLPIRGDAALRELANNPPDSGIALLTLRRAQQSPRYLGRS